MEFTSQSSVASNVRATLFGLISFPVDVVPQGRTGKREETQFKQLCPQGHKVPGLMPVKQYYECDGGHTGLRQGDLVRGRQTEDGKWVLPTAEEIEAATCGSLEAGAIDLTPHPADVVNSSTRPGEKGYRLRPGRSGKKVTAKEAQLYATIRQLVIDNVDKVAFIGSLRIRNSRAVYRLEVWDGQLMLTELVCDEDLAARDVIDVDGDPKLLGMAQQFLETSVEDWDPSLHRWDAGTAVAELVARKAAVDAGEAVPVPDRIELPDNDDLVAKLAAAMEAKRAVSA